MDSVAWWTAFGAIAQAVGAVATFTAVAVSLWIVRSERQLRAKATAGIRMFFVGDGSPGVYIVGVTILNTGLRPLRVTSTGWRTGWIGRGAQAFKHRFAVQNTSIVEYGKRPPFVIEPGMEESVYTTVEDMKRGARVNAEAHKELFERHNRILGHAPIHAVISFTGRPALHVPVEPALATFLRTNHHANSTAVD